MDVDDLEAHVRAMEQKYRHAEHLEARAEEWQTEGAEIVLSATHCWQDSEGVTAEARGDGINVGVLRPITLYPFPVLHFQRLAEKARVFVVVEMSNGQLVDDVRLALNGIRPVEFLAAREAMFRRTKRCLRLSAVLLANFRVSYLATGKTIRARNRTG